MGNKGVALFSAGQSVDVTVALVGRQDVSVAAVQPMTEGAAISVRIDRLLIYMGDVGTVVSFARTWRDVVPGLAESLRGSRHDLLNRQGRSGAEPSVFYEAVGSPPGQVWSERRASGRQQLRVRLGHLVFNVHDMRAYRSVVEGFTRAEDLIAATFPVPGPRPDRAAVSTLISSSRASPRASETAAAVDAAAAALSAASGAGRGGSARSAPDSSAPTRGDVAAKSVRARQEEQAPRLR